VKQYKDKLFINFEWISEQLMEENARQLEKWGVQERSAFEWLTYAAEELGSLAKAINENHYRKGLKEKVVSEAFHVATLALKIAEMFKEEE
jgi:NTP pyrophosphatase (non-canonical NTP hydrolase)